MPSKLGQIFVTFLVIGYIENLNICGKWVQYEDTKCIKVLGQKATEEEALRHCVEYDSDSTLITIHSQDEQKFLNNLLGSFETISKFAWIGLKYLNRTYNWLDGTDNKYTNWADDAIKDGNEPCVQMSLSKIDLGKWIDESCKRTALTVCQKKQIFSLNTLRTAFETIENKTTYLETELESMKMLASVPLGFLYTQFPNQSSPEKLWTDTSWTEVTDEYAGLFFRAEGPQSLPFGQIQSANQSWISNRYYLGGVGSKPNIKDRATIPPWVTKATIPPKVTKATILTKVAIPTEITPSGYLDSEIKGEWDRLPSYSSYNGKSGVTSFYTTEGVRPRNTAIRIWKRSG